MMNTQQNHEPGAAADLQSDARRRLLLGAGILSAAAAIGTARAADVSHAHHGMGQGSRGLIDAASHCIEEAEICDQHCLALFKQGDTALADCAQRVRELAALCTAARQLSVQQSPRLMALLAVCQESCMACEEECRKHAAKHPVCESCADACVGTVDEIKAHAA